MKRAAIVIGVLLVIGAFVALIVLLYNAAQGTRQGLAIARAPSSTGGTMTMGPVFVNGVAT